MPIAEFPNLVPAAPELFLACVSMALLMLGVFIKGKAATKTVNIIAIVSLALAAMLVSAVSVERTVTFNGMFVNDGFGAFAKILCLLASVLAIIMAQGFFDRSKTNRFEFPILVVLAVLGMMMMISANNLISLYVGLELQSLSLYVLAAFQRNNLKATESGLKYFVLGSLASGMLLYGSSLVYGFAGTTSFDGLENVFSAAHGHVDAGIIVGLVFITAGLAFKVSAVPFHMWTPDVYEGAPTPVTAFFAVAPKIAAICLFLRVLVGPFGDLVGDWQQVIVLISALSMIVGAFAAIVQKNIKRMMAYSSIGHVGFALMGLAAGNEAGVQAVLVYMAIYLFMNVGAFACILCMKKGDLMVEGIQDLAGLAKSHPIMAVVMSMFMFSMAGIPPLAGFFSKWYVLAAAVDAGLITLAVIAVLSSVVSCFYYIRIIKVMYFDESEEALDTPIGKEMTVILAGTAAVVALFIVFPGPDHRQRFGRRRRAVCGMSAQPNLPPAFGLVAFDTVESTNDEAKRLAGDGALDGTVVWAKSQTGGRGRRGRSWVSDPGNLFFSLILRPTCSIAEASQLSFASAVAMARAFEELTGGLIEFRCKWPNDVLGNGLKMAGILLETQADASIKGDDPVPEWLILGIGANIASHPEGTEFPAGSLDRNLEPAALLAAFCAHFEQLRIKWREEGFNPIRSAWLDLAAGLGGIITARLPNETLEGRFVGLDEDGALVLESEGGKRHITSADVFFPN